MICYTCACNMKYEISSVNFFSSGREAHPKKGKSKRKDLPLLK